MSIRAVKRVQRARPHLEGAGVKLQRAFGFGNTTDFDPFLLFDDFRNENPDDYLAGFPWHPHRGIETITYVLAGNVEHGDSLGNRGSLGAGDVQWMTAGSGIMHQEMPKGDPQGRMHGFQLWANLPASLKMTAPRYQDVPAQAIPEVVDDDGTRVQGDRGRLLGETRARGRGGGRPAIHRCVGAAGPAQTAGGGELPARVRVRVRGLGHVPRRLRASRGLDRARRRERRGEARRHRKPLARAVRQWRRGRRAGGRRGHPVPARVWEADRRTGRVVRADRHEHSGAAAGRRSPSCGMAPSSSNVERQT